MRIIELTTETIDLIGVNTVVGSHIEVLSKEEGDNKIIIKANTKATVDNLIPPMGTIIIITKAIIKAEVVVAMAGTISDPAVTEEAIIEAIIITNTTNTTHMMMVHRLNNMAHHVNFTMALIILLNIALKVNMTSIIS